MKNRSTLVIFLVSSIFSGMGCAPETGDQRYGVPFASIEEFEAAVREGTALQHLYATDAGHIEANDALADETEEWLQFLVDEAGVVTVEFEPFDPYEQGYRTHRFHESIVYEIDPEPHGTIRIAFGDGGTLVFFYFEKNSEYYLCSGIPVAEISSPDHIVGGSLIIEPTDDESVNSEFEWMVGNVTVTAYSKFEPGVSGGVSDYGDRFVEWRLLADVSVRSLNVGDIDGDLEVEIIRQDGVTIIRPNSYED